MAVRYQPDDAQLRFLRLAAPRSLTSGRRRLRRRRWRWRRGCSFDGLRRRRRLLLCTRGDERHRSQHGNHCRITEQPVAGHCFGNVEHPVLPG
jgi:hypothetical protein